MPTHKSGKGRGSKQAIVDLDRERIRRRRSPESRVIAKVNRFIGKARGLLEEEMGRPVSDHEIARHIREASKSKEGASLDDTEAFLARVLASIQEKEKSKKK